MRDEDRVNLDIRNDTPADEPVCLTHAPEKDGAKDPFLTRIHVRKGVKACVLEIYTAGAEGEYASDAVAEIVVEEGAVLEHVQAHFHGAGASYSGRITVEQAADSRYLSFVVTNGARVFQNHLSVLVRGEGADAVLNGLHLLKKGRSAESRTFVDHASANAASRQLYKCILEDNARSDFLGRILVRSQAQGTRSYQLNKNLLLSPDCRANTRPELEIFADDVKCSHGATIGQLNGDEIFYLETRGIKRGDAARLLVRGFIDDVLGQISNEKVRQQVSDRVSRENKNVI